MSVQTVWRKNKDYYYYYYYYFGPDFDSRSGCGSAFTDLQSGSPQKHGFSFTDFLHIERTYLDMDLTLNRVRLLPAVDGGIV